MDFSFRKNEGLLLLKQDNEKQTITIEGVNEAALYLLSYGTNDVLRGKSFVDILGEDSRELVEEGVEYEDDAFDLLQLIQKHKSLTFLNKQEGEISNSFKIVRTTAQDRNHWFRLILIDERHKRELEGFQTVLRDNFKGHEVLDEETSLPNYATMVKDLELAQHYSSSQKIHNCFVYVEMGNYDLLTSHDPKYGPRSLRTAAQQLRTMLRQDDVLARISDNALGVLLIDIHPDAAAVVVNRLRLAANAGTLDIDVQALKSISVRVAHSSLDAGDVQALLVKQQKALEASPSDDVVSVVM